MEKKKKVDVYQVIKKVLIHQALHNEEKTIWFDLKIWLKNKIIS